MAAVRYNCNRYACGLGTIQLEIPPGSLKINEKSSSTDASPSDMQTNTVKLYQAKLLLLCQCNIHACLLSAISSRELLSCCSCNIYACWPSVFTATNTSAFQICLLVECCCKKDACWTVFTQSASLPIFCHSVLHVCRCFASLSAIPVGTVSHYQPCQLVWYLIIGHAFWWCAALSVMPVCMLPHYRPRLLVRCLIINHACWCVASL